MTDNDIKKNLRNYYKKELFITGGIALVTTIIALVFIASIIKEDYNSILLVFMVIVAILITWFAIHNDILFVDYLKLYLNPFDDDRLKKYGTPEEVLSILRKLVNHPEYDDGEVIISKKYLCRKDDLITLIAIKDIKKIEKEEDPALIKVSIIDKTGSYFVTYYITNNKNRKKADYLVDYVNKIIGKKGNNSSAEDDDESIEEDEEYFTCDNCGAKVKEDADKCPKCGVIFEEEDEDDEDDEDDDFDEEDEDEELEDEDDDDEDEDEDEEEETDSSDISVDDKYNSLVKLKDLLDKDIITKEEFEEEKKKILK